MFNKSAMQEAAEGVAIGQEEVSRSQIEDAVETLKEWGYDASIAPSGADRIQILNLPRLAVQILFRRPASRIISIDKHPRSVRVVVRVAARHPELEELSRTTKFIFLKSGRVNVSMDEAWDMAVPVPRIGD